MGKQKGGPGLDQAETTEILQEGDAEHNVRARSGRSVFAVTGLADREFAAEELLERGDEPELVANGEFNVDPLDRVGIGAQAIERDHDVFIDLERVGVLGNRSRTGPGRARRSFLRLH